MSLPEKRAHDLGIPGLRLARNSLELPRGLSYEDWQGVVLQLAKWYESIEWWVGDALAYGENEYGECYWQIEHALQEAGFTRTRGTLWNYASVSRRVPPSLRNEELSWSHHLEVAKIKDPDRQRDLLRRAAENGWKVRRLRAEVNRPVPLNPGAPAEGERYRLIAADITQLGIELDPGSVDVIVTDPPYSAEYLWVYSDLGRVAARVLKPGGRAYVMVGHFYLPQVLDSLTAHLGYFWALCYWTPGASPRVWHRPFVQQWKPVLVFVNGEPSEYRGPQHITDFVRSDAPEKGAHRWQQSLSGMEALLDVAALPGETVLDPFCGSGTTGIAALQHGCDFIGADVEQSAVDTTAARLSETATLLEAQDLVDAGEATWVEP